MSTDRNRLTSAIQRIAREDPEIRKLLDDYRNSGGFPSASATSESGGDDRGICCDGSTIGNANPGSDTKDPSDGGQDAGDGLDPDDPANLSEMGPGSLTGVNDCATGEPVCFDGGDWIPPEGWESPTDPPLDTSYEAGKFWSAQWSWFGPINGTGAYALGESAACSKSEDLFLQIYPGQSGSGSCLSGHIDCADNPNDPEGYCSPDEDDFNEITADAWPTDGCTNLAIKGGKIVGSKYDPENDGSYSAPRDSIELCDDFGNSFELKPSASGGWKSISASNPGDGYLYSSTGEQIARISGSEFSDPNV